MNFDYSGYHVKFIQREPCRDESAHLFTLVFKFFSPVTAYHYVVRAEYHTHHVFAVKFYCKKDRKSEFKYSKIINRGDIGNILASAASVIPIVLNNFPNVSFVFAASRSVGANNKPLEGYSLTQRFKLYAYLMPLRFGSATFEHYSYPSISSYMLYHRNAPKHRSEIENMLKDTYEGLLNV